VALDGLQVLEAPAICTMRREAREATHSLVEARAEELERGLACRQRKVAGADGAGVARRLRWVQIA